MNEIQTRSRRSLLAAAAGGAAALAVNAALPASVVRATSGTMEYGADNVADAATTLSTAAGLDGAAVMSFTNSAAAAGSDGVRGVSTGGATDVDLTTHGGSGVRAEGTSFGQGVYAVSGSAAGVATDTHLTGVYGYAAHSDDLQWSGSGVWGDSPDTGVFGSGYYGVYGAGGFGVYGFTQAGKTGVGVYGDGDVAGTGLYGYSGSGYGLVVEGRFRLANKSGKFSVAKGRSSYAKTGLVGVTSSSIVIAVLQNVPSGTWIRAAVPGSGKITIYFNRTLPSTAVVGWMVLN